MKNAQQQIDEISSALKKVAVSSLRGLVAKLDTLTKKHTIFPTFSAMVHSKTQKGPTFPKRPAHPISNFFANEYAELDLLALCYDMAQEARGDSRRAYRS